MPRNAGLLTPDSGQVMYYQRHERKFLRHREDCYTLAHLVQKPADYWHGNSVFLRPGGKLRRCSRWQETPK